MITEMSYDQYIDLNKNINNYQYPNFTTERLNKSQKSNKCYEKQQNTK